MQPIARIPWSSYSHVNHFAAAPGVNKAGVGDGTLSHNYILRSNVPVFVSAAHAAGKQALLTIMDRPSYPYAFGQSTAPAMVGAFASNIASFVRQYGYDGVDIDWEGNVSADRYIALIAKLRLELPSKTITVSMNPFEPFPRIASNTQSKLDQINIMCYDMDRAQGFVWYLNAIYPSSNSIDNSCDSHITTLLNAGVSRAKLGIGIPFYGRRWTGVTRSLQPVDAANAFTITYSQLVRDPSRWNSTDSYYDGRYKASFLSNPTLNEFITYTSPDHVAAIVSWAKARGVNGFMTFATEYEYIAEQTGNLRYPLSTALYNAVQGGAPPGSRITATVTMPPLLTQLAPSGTLSPQAAFSTISLMTDLESTCSYSPASNLLHSAAQPFSATGGTVHSTLVTGLTGGSTYRYFVKCMSVSSGDTSVDYLLSFATAVPGDPRPLPLAITPAAGTGASQSFTVQATDPRGYANINQVDLIIGDSIGASANCRMEYWAPSRTMFLKSDSGAWMSAALGAGTILQNNQCIVDTRGVVVSGSATTLSLRIPVTFRTGYTGAKGLFVNFGNADGYASGWQVPGFWKVQ